MARIRGLDHGAAFKRGGSQPNREGICRQKGCEFASSTYQYRCDECRAKFERSETISEHERSKAKCPKCGSKKVAQIPATFTW
jgi:putative FmdB family regulatory protein